MVLQYSTRVKNARLDVVESTIGASAILKIRTGAAPANCAAADAGTVLATINLPADWMSAASGGAKAKLGTWSDASADATGTAGHFRIYDSGGATCDMQGSITATGGGGDMILDSVSISAGQQVDVTAFGLTAGN
ncbi:MAG: hypothetical protein KAY22_26770 [Rhizorhabdus sp.]|uniref:hypothetical protein n=1 Tax=Rhizorhabdus sp. TaxID=1968843 RepID=UPI001B7411C6|nr:hypothetical protein [Rhizorhabdus sp.]MBP8235902.1 hypothetical protein [Rhizorhabdus sp.]